MPDSNSTLLCPPPLPVAALPTARWRWWTHLLLIVPYPLLAGLRGADRHDTHQAALSGDWHSLLEVCGFEMALFGIIVAIAFSISKATRDDLMFRFRGMSRMTALGIGYSVAVRITLGIVVAIISMALIITHVITPAALQTFVKANQPDVTTVVNIDALKHDPIYYWLTLTVVSFVVAGLREELWRSASLTALRKLWPRCFATSGGQYAAVVLTSLVFGIGHLPQGGLAVGLTTVLGIALGSIMVFHRSAWPAVIAHGMFDATSFALIPLVIDKL